MKRFIAQRKRIITTAAFLLVVGFSFIPAQPTSALSLRDILQGLTTRPERTPEPTPPRTEETTRQQTPTPAPVQNQPPAQPTPAPVQETPPAPAPTPVQPNRVVQPIQPVAPAEAEVVAAPVKPDTSDQVLTVASLQTVPAVPVAESIYTTKQLDPIIAQQLLIAGLSSAILGLVLYTVTFVRANRRRPIPVKYYSS